MSEYVPITFGGIAGKYQYGAVTVGKDVYRQIDQDHLATLEDLFIDLQAANAAVKGAKSRRGGELLSFAHIQRPGMKVQAGAFGAEKDVKEAAQRVSAQLLDQIRTLVATHGLKESEAPSRRLFAQPPPIRVTRRGAQPASPPARGLPAAQAHDQATIRDLRQQLADLQRSYDYDRALWTDENQRLRQRLDEVEAFFKRQMKALEQELAAAGDPHEADRLRQELAQVQRDHQQEIAQLQQQFTDQLGAQRRQAQAQLDARPTPEQLARVTQQLGQLQASSGARITELQEENLALAAQVSQGQEAEQAATELAQLVGRKTDQIKSLRREHTKAIRDLENAHAMRLSSQIIDFDKHRQSMEGRMTTLRGQLETARQDLAAARAKGAGHEALQAEHAQLQVAFKEEQAKLAALNQRHAVELDRLRAQLQHEQEAATTAAEQHATAAAKLGRDLAQVTKRADTQEATIAALEKAKAAAERARDQEAQRAGKLAEQVGRLEDDVATAEAAQQRAEEGLIPLQARISELEAAPQVDPAEVAGLKERLAIAEALAREADELRDLVSELGRKNTELGLQLDKANADIDTYEDQAQAINRLERALRVAIEEKDVAQRKLAEAAAAFDQEIEDLEAAVAADKQARWARVEELRVEKEALSDELAAFQAMPRFEDRQQEVLDLARRNRELEAKLEQVSGLLRDSEDSLAFEQQRVKHSEDTIRALKEEAEDLRWYKEQYGQAVAEAVELQERDLKRSPEIKRLEVEGARAEEALGDLSRETREQRQLLRHGMEAGLTVAAREEEVRAELEAERDELSQARAEIERLEYLNMQAGELGQALLQQNVALQARVDELDQAHRTILEEVTRLREAREGQ